MELGTITPYSNFDAKADADVLRNAVRPYHADTDAITSVLSARASYQRLEVVKTYQYMCGKDLIADLKSKLEGDYEAVCTGLCVSTTDFVAATLNKAVAGAGAKEEMMIAILCTRTNAEMQELKEAYQRLYGKNLQMVIKGETSGHFQNLLVSLAQGNRDESAAVDYAKAQTDAIELYEAGGKNANMIDESKLIDILVSRSYAQLRAIFNVYRKVSGYREIESSIESNIRIEVSGSLRQGLLALVKTAKYKPAMFAELLNTSIKGAGTDDEMLRHVIVSRCEIDLVQIRETFERNYNKSLDQMIKGEHLRTTEYEKIILTLIG